MLTFPISNTHRACIAGIQVRNAPARTKEEQRTNIERHLTMAKPLFGKATLVLFPELSTVGDIDFENRHFLAETFEGPACDIFSRAAGTPSTERKILEKTPDLVLIPMLAEIGAAYHYKAIAWQTSILAINYAGFHYGYSSLHRFVEGREVFRQSLFTNEGFLVTTL